MIDLVHMHRTPAARVLKAYLALLLLGAASLGCNDDQVDLGSGTPRVGVVGSSLSDYSGSWDGYAEAYSFSDESDRIRLVISTDGTGHLEFGDSEPLPPPDPDKGYPPTAHVPDQGSPGRSGARQALNQGLAGFEYTLSKATVEGNRVRLKVSHNQPLQEWCELQTPILDEANSTESDRIYHCVPNAEFAVRGDRCEFIFPNYDPLEGPCTGDNCFRRESIDCGKLSCKTDALCQCKAEGCDAGELDEGISMDAALEQDGDKLVGTLLLVGKRITVRLNRTTP